jgi:hypothetical protein
VYYACYLCQPIILFMLPAAKNNVQGHAVADCLASCSFWLDSASQPHITTAVTMAVFMHAVCSVMLIGSTCWGAHSMPAIFCC